MTSTGYHSDRKTTTRYATIVVDPGDDGFSHDSRVFLEEASVTYERVHHVDVLADGTIVGLYELHGEIEQIRSGIADLPGVLSYDVVGADPAFVYLHEQATEPAKTMLQQLHGSTVVVDHPFEYHMDGRIRMTILGDAESLRHTYASLREVIDVTLEETGIYEPEVGDLGSLLTSRQREILHIAISRGYYDVPRQATHQDIAEACGLSQSTVAEHLQKSEATILPHVLHSGEGQDRKPEYHR